MRNLIINSISIISPETEKAKYQKFNSGINLVIGDENKGNFIGKSSLLRSIFHTLGADSKYNMADWEKEGPYIYILDFNFSGKSYKMLRKQELFKLYEEKELLFSVINREALSEELSKIFLDKLYFLNYENKYSLAHPVYSYLLNYIEQTEIKLCDFKSFNNLTAFPRSYYSDLLYELVGSNNKEYNDSIKKLKEIEEKITKSKNKTDYLKEMLKEINKSSLNEISTDNIDVLRKTLKDYQEEYSEYIVEADKLKKNVYSAYSVKTELETLIDTLKKAINDGNLINKKILNEHTCPTCQSELHDSKGYFNNSNNIENYKFQLIDLEKNLGNIERTIELEMNKYEKNILEMKKLEKKIFGGNNKIKDQLSYIGLRELSNNVHLEMSEINSKIDSYQKETKDLNSVIRKHRRTRKEIDEYYIETLTNRAFNYEIRIPALDKIKKLDQVFKSDGNEVMLTTVTWLTSILETKYKFNQTSTIYPLIYDNPNNANFDRVNDSKIFRLIFDSIPNNGQIITSSVGFDKDLFKLYDINTITLDNERYSLLNKEDYKICSHILQNL